MNDMARADVMVGLHDLAGALDRFVSQHRRSADDAHRWMANEVLPDILKRVQSITNRRQLTQADADALREFRVREVENALAGKQAEVRTIERDLAKLRGEVG